MEKNWICWTPESEFQILSTLNSTTFQIFNQNCFPLFMFYRQIWKEHTVIEDSILEALSKVLLFSSSLEILYVRIRFDDKNCNSANMTEQGWKLFIEHLTLSKIKELKINFMPNLPGLVLLLQALPRTNLQHFYVERDYQNPLPWDFKTVNEAIVDILSKTKIKKLERIFCEICRPNNRDEACFMSCPKYQDLESNLAMSFITKGIECELK